MDSIIKQTGARSRPALAKLFQRSKRVLATSAQGVEVSRGTDGNQVDFASVARSLTNGEIAAHNLEKVMGNNSDAVIMRRDYVSNLIADSGLRPGAISGLPATGSDFDSARFYDEVYGTNCESVVGYLPVPVGVMGPLVVNDQPYQVPLATTEGALIASANRGARALAQSVEGGIRAAVYRDGITRSPVVRFQSAMRAIEFVDWLNQPEALERMKAAYATTTRFGKLVSVKPSIAGKMVFMRFSAQTGEAMGMNSISKGVNAVLEDLLAEFNDMKVVALSGNVCMDKKPSAVNWIEGRGKSVVAEATLPREVVERVLKTTVKEMGSLNVSKNLVGSSLAGSIGGNNAHAANLVAALYIATGQDPAQTVGSSNCMTLLEPSDDGEFLHVSCSMPSIEVGCIGGGTTLRAQSACLDMLGVRGVHPDIPGGNVRRLAEIVCSTVLAGELSLMAALASGHLISAHMELNRKPSDAATSTTSATVASTAAPAAQPYMKKKTLSHSSRTINSNGRHSTTFHGGFASKSVPESVSAVPMAEPLDSDMEPRLPIP